MACSARIGDPCRQIDRLSQTDRQTDRQREREREREKREREKERTLLGAFDNGGGSRA